MSWADLQNITFAHPWAFLLLLLLPLLAFLKGREGAAPTILFSTLEPLRQIAKPRKMRRGRFRFDLMTAALAFFIAALARPQISNVTQRVEASGIDIMIAMDVSRSMLAEDITIGSEQGNRFEAVVKLTEDFIRSRKNDRIGMLAFAGRPYLISPLTLDHDWLLKNLDRVQIGMVEDGTAIGSALASAGSRLKERKDSKSRIIVLLTDGDNNAGKVDPPTAAEAARALGIKIYAVGIGSNGTAMIPIPDGMGRLVRRPIPVQMDEKNLRRLAEIGKGQFYRATDSNSLRKIFEQIDALEKTSVEMTITTQVRELFPWLVVCGAALAALWQIWQLTLGRRAP